VRVADARKVKLIWQARSKTDAIDARELAELLRVNLFPTIWIPDPGTRRRRQLLHGRAFRVRQRRSDSRRLRKRVPLDSFASELDVRLLPLRGMILKMKNTAVLVIALSLAFFPLECECQGTRRQCTHRIFLPLSQGRIDAWRQLRH